jgi:molybdopterin synthase sulfur carrier subunit
MVTVRLFAAAAEAVGAYEVSLDAATVADARAALGAVGKGAVLIGSAAAGSAGSGTVGNDAHSVIRQCAVLEAGVRLEDDHPLAHGAVIDVMPPFAGG